MTTDTSSPAPDGTRIGALFFANLAGPLAALAVQELAYIFTDRACHGGGSMTPVHLTFLAGILIAISAGLVGRREYRCHPERSEGAEARSRFLAHVGMLVGPFAALAIAAQWAATLFFHPCQ